MADITLVTGAGGALGSEVARVLAARGHKLVLCDGAHAEARLETLSSELGAGVAVTSAQDFSTRHAYAEALGKARGRLGGGLTGACLVAGGWQGGKRFHETDPAVWDAMISQNLETVRRALEALLPPMVTAKKGSLVVVGSRAAVRPWTSANAAAYAASKAAVVALMEAVAQEVLEDGVRINAILPSTMDTKANRGAMPDADPTRWVSLASAAGLVAFLLSEEARDISGAAIPIYGRA